MKTILSAIALFAFFGLLYTGCSEKSQAPLEPFEQGTIEKVILTQFTFSHNPIPPYIIDPGEVKLVGGNWILKDVGVIETVISSDPLVSGTMIHYLSATMNAVTGEGPVHGKSFHTPSSGGGVWEGTYQGYRSRMPGSDTLFVLPLKVVAHGKGGAIDGMKAFYNSTIIAWGTPPVGWFGSGEGYYK